eukprot:10300634-Ditylum_brightwellii.AAC.1
MQSKRQVSARLETIMEGKDVLSEEEIKDRKQKQLRVYLEHTKSLQDTGIALKESPTIGKLQDLEGEKCQWYDEDNSIKQKDQHSMYL